MAKVDVVDFMTCPKCDQTDRDLKVPLDDEYYFPHTCSKCGFFFKLTFDLETHLRNIFN